MRKQVLLTWNNTKTIKSLKVNDVETQLPFFTYILYLSPFTQNSKNINVCSHASKGCAESCLFGSGFGGMYNRIAQGRIKKTEYFLSSRNEFMEQLRFEIAKAVKKHEGEAIVTIRLNGTSDLPFEKYKVFENGTKNIFEMFPDVQFYDYTKNYLRFEKKLPSNYHLTFSRSETNGVKSLELLNKGFNVAMVFNKLPSEYEGFEVVNGDLDDLRFLDKKNVIVGLKYKRMTGKGGAEKNKLALTSGFVIDTLNVSSEELLKAS